MFSILGGQIPLPFWLLALSSEPSLLRKRAAASHSDNSPTSNGRSFVFIQPYFDSRCVVVDQAQ